MKKRYRKVDKTACACKETANMADYAIKTLSHYLTPASSGLRRLLSRRGNDSSDQAPTLPSNGFWPTFSVQSKHTPLDRLLDGIASLD